MFKGAVVQISYCQYPSAYFRSTQPGHPFMGRRNEYQPKGGDALRLGSKGRYGSYVGGSLAGKTVWSPCYTWAISERFGGDSWLSALYKLTYTLLYFRPWLSKLNTCFWSELAVGLHVRGGLQNNRATIYGTPRRRCWPTWSASSAASKYHPFRAVHQAVYCWQPCFSRCRSSSLERSVRGRRLIVIIAGFPQP